MGVVERHGIGGNLALQEAAVVLALKTIKQVFYWRTKAEIAGHAEISPME